MFNCLFINIWLSYLYILYVDIFNLQVGCLLLCVLVFKPYKYIIVFVTYIICNNFTYDFPLNVVPAGWVELVSFSAGCTFCGQHWYIFFPINIQFAALTYTRETVHYIFLQWGVFLKDVCVYTLIGNSCFF